MKSKELRDILKQRRKELHLTQQGLAAASKKKHQSFFSKIEKGERKITVDDFEFLEKVYKIKINLDIKGV